MVGDDRYTDRIFGDVSVDRDSARLVVTTRDQGEMNLHGCAFLVFAMACILALGVMAMVSQTRYAGDGVDFVAPRRNHFGFLWLVSTGAMVVFTPLWMRYLYRSSAQTVLSLPDAMVRRNNRDVAPLRKVECIRIQERRDPDNAFLYEVSLVHSDGMELLVSAVYDERCAMNLANEMGAFAGIEVRWR